MSESHDNNWGRDFKPLSIKEYLNNKDLSEKVECSAKRIHRIITEECIKVKDMISYPFFSEGNYSINGLPEFKEGFVEAVDACALSYKHNSLPLILITGPTGCGKTELGRRIEEGLINGLYNNARYTYKFKDKNTCPFNEDPINLLTTSYVLIDKKLKDNYSKLSNNELCPECRNNLEELIRSNKNHDNYLELINDNIEVLRLNPRTAMIDLTERNFSKKFIKAVMNANRGILHINIDDRNFEDIPDINYQLLLSLADRKLSLDNCTYFTPDMLVLLYANDDIFVSEEGFDWAVFKDRTLSLCMRRNLSYTQEELIFKKLGVDKVFKHVTPEGLGILARFTVGSRIVTVADEFEHRLETYNRYELLKDYTKKESDIIKERLLNNSPIDGWADGLSTRNAVNNIYSLIPKNECLTLDNIIRFLEESKNYLNEYCDDLTYDYSIKMAKDIAFRDSALAFTALTLGSIEAVDKRFNDLIELLKEKIVNKKTVINTINEGLINIDEAIINNLKNINIDPDKMHDVIKTIDKCVGPDGVDNLTYGYILNIHPELITGGNSIKNYINWQELSRGVLIPNDEVKVNELIKIMNELGYEDDCAKSALKIASERILKL